MSTLSKKELHELRVNIGKILKNISRRIPDIVEEEELIIILDSLQFLDRKIKSNLISSLERRIEELDQEES